MPNGKWRDSRFLHQFCRVASGKICNNFAASKFPQAHATRLVEWATGFQNITQPAAASRQQQTTATIVLRVAATLTLASM